MRNYIMESARVAEVAHRGQLRKFTKRPYITHPGRVASMVMLLPEATEAMVAAAWLHDVLEDTEIGEAVLRSSLAPATESPDVIDKTIELVKELTNHYTKENYPGMRREERKAKEIARLKTISPQAKLIKLCDRIDNLREMDPRDGFTAEYLKESAALLAALDSVQDEPLPLMQKVSRAELCLSLREEIETLLVKVEKHRNLKQKLTEIYGVFE